MCRIGVGCSIENFQAKYLSEAVTDAMVVMSDHSNRDGFGMYYSNYGSNLSSAMYKKARPCSEVVLTPDFFNWKKQNNSGYGPFICHVRQATTGKGELSNDAYAHPFSYENYTLVHNGHLFNADEVRNNLKIPNSVVVDSEIFLHSLLKMANNGDLTEEVIQKTVDLFIGPFVFVVHKKENDFVWLIIGKGRTLFYYEHPNYAIALTDSGYAGTLTRGLYRSGYDNNLDWAPVKPAIKLEQDSIYKLGINGVHELGKISSKEELPKSVIVREPVAKSTGIIVSSSRADDFDLSDIFLNIENRRRILNKYGLKEHHLKQILTELYPIYPLDFYSLDNEQLILLDSFLDSIGITPTRVEELRKIWTEFNEQLYAKDKTADPYIVIRSSNEKFIKPYFMNTTETVKDILKIKL